MTLSVVLHCTYGLVYDYIVWQDFFYEFSLFFIAFLLLPFIWRINIIKIYTCIKYRHLLHI